MLPLLGIISHDAVPPIPEFLKDPLTSPLIWSVPIDGTTVCPRTNGGFDVFNYAVSTTKFKISDLSDSIHWLKERNFLGWGRCRYNFAVSKITGPGGVVDWFNPNLAFEENVSLIGEFSARAGLYGVAFDPEPYLNQWLYTAMPGAGSHTFLEYVAKVQAVAKNIVKRWLAANPDIKIWTFQSYAPYVNVGGLDENNPYGLWKYFLDTMHDELGAALSFSEEGCKMGDCRISTAKILLTDESTYGCLSNNCLNTGINQCNGAAGAAYKGSSPYFGLVDNFGAGLYLTHPAFNPATPGANFFTPGVLGAVLHQLILYGQTLPWIYTDVRSFLNPALPMPQDYLDALFIVRDECGLI